MNSCYHYAHYYVGHNFRYTWPDGEWVEGKIWGIGTNGWLHGDCYLNSEGQKKDLDYDFDDIRDEKFGIFQLILRAEMTKKEKAEYYSLCTRFKLESGEKAIVDTPYSLEYLFVRGIDAFHLIDNGYAIEYHVPISAYLKRKAKKALENSPSGEI